MYTFLQPALDLYTQYVRNNDSAQLWKTEVLCLLSASPSVSCVGVRGIHIASGRLFDVYN